MNKKWYLLGGGLVLSVGLMSAYAYQSPVKEFQGISYMTAHWQEDRKHTKNILESRQGFNLRLEFMREKKIPLNNAKIRVHDSNHKLIFAQTVDKSMLLMRLKPGLYQIEAEYQGKPLETKVAVPKSRSRYVMFRWNKEGVDSQSKTQRISANSRVESLPQKASTLAMPMQIAYNKSNSHVNVKGLFTSDGSQRGGIHKREAQRALKANQTEPVVKIVSKHSFVE